MRNNLVSYACWETREKLPTLVVYFRITRHLPHVWDSIRSKRVRRAAEDPALHRYRVARIAAPDFESTNHVLELVQDL